MSKDQALDIMWGRQGGRRAAGTAGQALQDIALLRKRGLQQGSWPSQLEAERCPICRRPFGDHEPGREQEEWEGRARMAMARLAAGSPLDGVDHMALDRCPEPPSWLAAWRDRQAA